MPTRLKGGDALPVNVNTRGQAVKGTKNDTKKRLSGLLNQVDNGLPLNLRRLPGRVFIEVA